MMITEPGEVCTEPRFTMESQAALVHAARPSSSSCHSGTRKLVPRHALRLSQRSDADAESRGCERLRRCKARSEPPE
eukprot:152147-Rhodomonas_salina.8